MAEEKDWEWVHSPPHRFHVSPRDDDDHDDEYSGFFGRDDEAMEPPAPVLHLHTNAIQIPEDLSSTASSPILKHNLSATVMAKDCISALDALHHSVSEWIEPQLVFTKPRGHHLEGVEVYKVVAHLRNLPNTKETLMSLLSDPKVCDAVTSNKAFRELAYKRADDDDDDDSLGGRDMMSACNSSLGGKAYKVLKEKLSEAVDVLLTVLGRHTFDKSVVDQVDATTKSCILLVVVLIFLVIGKRSDEGF